MISTAMIESWPSLAAPDPGGADVPLQHPPG